jgi:hypothetical protein
MTEKEFNLSEKMIDEDEIAMLGFHSNKNFYSEEDVREFIRRLKLQIAKYGMIKDKNTYQRMRMVMANCILEDLDKLAGEKLSK